MNNAGIISILPEIITSCSVHCDLFVCYGRKHVLWSTTGTIHSVEANCSYSGKGNDLESDQLDTAPSILDFYVP